MNRLFKRKLENIHSNLMEAHRDSQYYSSSIAGAEREAVKKKLLSLALPPGYRIGSGTIVDATGKETGQVDGVIEQPYSLSFPVATDSNRLYLADTIGAAFEIKSNLNSQGDEALAKIREIRRIQKHHVESDDITLYDLLFIPSFIVSFLGPKKKKTIVDNFINVRNSFFPNGVLVLESEIFVGRSFEARWYSGEGKAECIHAFLSCLIETLRYGEQNELDLLRYSALLK
ncbi:DUF6602 domain-containing protein [Pseudomonas tremae]|uniref:DUF6602 domain-containing protein n=1 Tax=Pseudomonas tremae TaxID=200454 RepID=UPI001F2309AF|nr:DUF6602 domain-containing protein [Pseudomonas tremae]MCF5745013.1 hypothetical protein [Pseudomonas tremae]UQB37468.1 hypothetical protein I9H09_03495 [Pseudomonas tremae]